VPLKSGGEAYNLKVERRPYNQKYNILQREKAIVGSKKWGDQGSLWPPRRDATDDK